MSNISYITGGYGANTIENFGSYQVGDVILVFAFRDGSTTPPSIPGNFTSIGTRAGTSCSATFGYCVANSTSVDIGGWTNASVTTGAVYRNVFAVGVSNKTSGTDSTVEFAELTGMVADGNSWVVGMMGTTAINLDTSVAPTGMSTRISDANSTADAATHDTNGGVSSWSVQSADIGGSSNWVSATIELISTGDATYGDTLAWAFP